MKVFRRRPHHGRPANVDILDDLFEIGARLGRGFLERIKIHHHHVDGRYPVLFHGGTMACHIPPMQDSAVHFGMQRLHSSVEHLGKTREVRDVANFDPLLA